MKIWKDHIIGENGEIIQDGTPVSAQNMNEIEKNIDKNSSSLVDITQEKRIIADEISSANKFLENYFKNASLGKSNIIFKQYLIEGNIANLTTSTIRFPNDGKFRYPVQIFAKNSTGNWKIEVVLDDYSWINSDTKGFEKIGVNALFMNTDNFLISSIFLENYNYTNEIDFTNLNINNSNEYRKIYLSSKSIEKVDIIISKYHSLVREEISYSFIYAESEVNLNV